MDKFKALQLAYLRGEVKDVSYSHGPLDSETDPLVAALLKMNEAGFLTIVS